MKAEHFIINPKFAHATGMPVSFAAIRVRETKKAVWVYGHGVVDPAGRCARCGRTLTHPGSILIGIGPECLGDWGAQKQMLENMTEKDKQYLRSLITDRKVDQWIPKACIKKAAPVEEVITLPENHKSLEPKLPEETPAAAPAVNNGTTTGTPATNPHATKRARQWKGRIAIAFPYASETVVRVKQLQGRKYHPDGKYWTADLIAYSAMKLKEWGFDLDEDLSKLLLTEASTIKTAEVKPVDLLGLKRDLFDYQKDGLAFLESRKGRALVGDEMGLGKTIQALAYLQLHPELRPALIVCPASLKLNWAKEIRETLTQRTKTQILEGKRPYNVHGDIVIINYDILPAWLPALQNVPKVIIADEVHYIKSNSAKRTKAMKLLAKSVPHFIGLSGTPIVNRPIEMYNALSIINSSVIPSFWTYVKRYCNAVHNGFGWDFTGASNTDELHKLLTETIMIRRKKADVLKDLPDKIHSFVPMTLDNDQEYRMVERDVIGYLKQVKGQAAADKASNAEVVVRIEQLKQAAVRGKIWSVIDWINDFLAASDEKLVVFATHKFVIDKLMHTFASQVIPNVVVKIDGSTSMADRNTAVELFQTNPKTRLLVGNIKAAGVGLTLTAASNVAIVEFPWTPGDLKQAEDRCHRIGQKDTVNVHLLMVEGTIEEKIAKLLDSKMKVLNAVLDGQQTAETSMLAELMKSLTEKM